MPVQYQMLNCERDTVPYEEITKVLNLSYEDWVNKNLLYRAATQTVTMTMERMKEGFCILAYEAGKIIGVVTVHIIQKEKEKRKWYEDEKYGEISQLAVLPQYRNGKVLVGLILYGRKCIFNKEQGLASFLFDTSVQANSLLRMYIGVGSQIVDYISWSGTNYYSYVLRYPLLKNRLNETYCKFRVCVACLWCHISYTKTGKQRKLYRLVRKSIRCINCLSRRKERRGAGAGNHSSSRTRK